MIRQRLAFLLSAGFLVVLGIAAGSSRSQAQDKEESPLEKIMEKVNKHNSLITKGVRNQVNFAKSQKDVEKSAKELAKLAKEAKPIKDAVGKAKGLAERPEEVGRIHRRLDQDLGKSGGRERETEYHCCECQECLQWSQEGMRRLPQGFPSRRRKLDRHGLRASVPHTRRGARFRGQWIAALGGPLLERNDLSRSDLFEHRGKPGAR